MKTDKHRLNNISEKIIGCAFTVSNTLGAGFLEKLLDCATGAGNDALANSPPLEGCPLGRGGHGGQT